MISFQLGFNLRGKLAIETAQRRDPRLERQLSPVNQMGREAYEFPSRSLADEGFETS